MMLSTKQAVEIFHLLFVSFLGQRVDKSMIALKGGCNLRFYFQSIRYSEDIDFDVRTVSLQTLKKNVDTILTATPFVSQLRSKGIEIQSFSAPKQTPATQRWKISLQVQGISSPIPTKIEFSRREFSENVIYEAADKTLISKYQLLPVLCQHYVLEEAILQKINALIGRTETQARDIFDLDLLLKKEFVLKSIKNNFQPSKVATAIENTMSVSYDQYASQVVTYLLDEYTEHYGSRDIWNKMQAELLQFLEKLS